MISEQDLLGLSHLSALEIKPERQKAVLDNLDRIAQVAAVVNAVELAPEDEIGPEWRP